MEEDQSNHWHISVQASTLMEYCGELICNPDEIVYTLTVRRVEVRCTEIIQELQTKPSIPYTLKDPVEKCRKLKPFVVYSIFHIVWGRQ